MFNLSRIFLTIETIENETVCDRTKIREGERVARYTCRGFDLLLNIM